MDINDNQGYHIRDFFKKNPKNFRRNLNLHVSTCATWSEQWELKATTEIKYPLAPWIIFLIRFSLSQEKTADRAGPNESSSEDKDAMMAEGIALAGSWAFLLPRAVKGHKASKGCWVRTVGAHSDVSGTKIYLQNNLLVFLMYIVVSWNGIWDSIPNIHSWKILEIFGNIQGHHFKAPKTVVSHYAGFPGNRRGEGSSCPRLQDQMLVMEDLEY